MTGIFTLRPSTGRFTTQRCRPGLAGQEAVQSVNGPMAKTLEDVKMYSKIIIDAQPWLVDPKMLPIPWRPAELKSKLKIAVLWNDGICQPTPPVTRALKETLEKLKKAGHEIIEWDPKLHATALQLLVRTLNTSESPQANSSRGACLWQMAVKVLKLYLLQQMNRIDPRWRCTSTRKNWALSICGSSI